MVREHECGRGKWDVELDSYRNVNGADPRWEPDQQIFNSANTLAELLVSNPELNRVRDWVHGDKVEMF